MIEGKEEVPRDAARLRWEEDWELDSLGFSPTSSLYHLYDFNETWANSTYFSYLTKLSKDLTRS